MPLPASGAGSKGFGGTRRGLGCSADQRKESRRLTSRRAYIARPSFRHASRRRPKQCGRTGCLRPLGIQTSDPVLGVGFASCRVSLAPNTHCLVHLADDYHWEAVTKVFRGGCQGLPCAWRHIQVCCLPDLRARMFLDSKSLGFVSLYKLSHHCMAMASTRPFCAQMSLLGPPASHELVI